MKFSGAKNTLAYHLENRPLNRQVDFKNLPMSHFSARAKHFLESSSSHNKVTPEHEALWFYLGNHILSCLRARYKPHAPLDSSDHALVEEHFKRANNVFLRLFYYTMVICVRETRHLSDKESLKKYLDAAGVTNSYALIKNVPDDAHSAMQSIIDGAPHGLTVYELAKGMSLAFHKMHWSSGYGGKKWGVIADALVNLVSGTHSPEVFCDVGFALAHNGGPIFNKGMFYGMYSDQLQIILDCQRGGQIPQYINSQHSKHVTSPMRENVMLASHLDPVFSEQLIDWKKVMDAGAIGHYSSLIVDPEVQKKKAEEAKKKAEEAAIKKKIAEEAAKHKIGEITYWPGQKVTLIKRSGLKELKDVG